MSAECECCKYCAESNQQKPVIATADLGTKINGKPWMFLDRYSKPSDMFDDLYWSNYMLFWALRVLVSA